MSPPLIVAAQGQMQALARALCATLPLSLRFNDTPARADLLILDGSDNWAENASAAIDTGIRRMIVLDPMPCATSALARLDEGRQRLGATIMLSETFAGNPAVAPFNDTLSDAASVFTFNGMAPEGAAHMIFAQLRLAGALGITGIDIIDAQSRDQSVMITARGLRAETTVTIRASFAQTGAVAPCLMANAHAPDSLARIKLYSGGVARAADTSVSNPKGEIGLPTVYETTHRHTLRLLLASDPRPAPPLAEFIRDCALMRKIAAA